MQTAREQEGSPKNTRRRSSRENAARAGVYSTRILEPRVAEIEREIESLSPPELRARTLRREVAGLLALVEAADQALAEQRLTGRSGGPHTLVNLRLRLHEKLTRALDAYEAAVTSAPGEPLEQGEHKAGEVGRNVGVLASIARTHRLPFDEIAPKDLNPDAFLEAVITTPDPQVSSANRLRARKLLTRRKKGRSDWCLCFPTRVARDEIELREWLDEARDAGLMPHKADAEMAAEVRQLAAGNHLDPWMMYRRRHAAVEFAIDEQVRRMAGQDSAHSDHQTREDDPTLRPFWIMLLSDDPFASVADRLKPLEALDEAGALRQCTCEPPTTRLWEEELDEARAYRIRLVSMSHWQAAIHRVRFPETFLAIRDAADRRALSDSLRH
jgi:hypothetical protein